MIFYKLSKDFYIKNKALSQHSEPAIVQAVIDHHAKLPPTEDSYSNYMADIIYHISTKKWYDQRKPFFRLWPGFIDAARTLDTKNMSFRKCEIQFPDGITSCCLEFPEGYLMVNGYMIRNITIGIVDLHKQIYSDKFNFMNDGFYHRYYHIGYHIQDGSSINSSYLWFPLTDEYTDCVIDDYIGEVLAIRPVEEIKAAYVDTVLKQVFIYAFFVGLISKIHTENDDGLITPCIINKFQDKWKETKNDEYKQRSINNGFYGWDIGKNLPNEDQIEQMRKDAIERGVISPHWRNPHFSRRIIGKREEGKREWRFVSGTFVNKDMMAEIPQGYYDKKNVKL